MGDIEFDMYQVDIGIPQGSPLSLILYLFYNADLLETASDKDIQTTGWLTMFTSSRGAHDRLTQSENRGQSIKGLGI